MANLSPATRSFLLNLVVGFFGLSIAVGCLEIGVRLITPDPKTKSASKPLTDRPKFFYNPLTASTMRGNTFSDSDPKREFRMAVIGDSFTFGPQMQFDDTFPSRLDRMLNLNHKEKKALVINYGSPGFSTQNETDLAQKAVAAQADLMILQITLNDPQLEPLRKTPDEFALNARLDPGLKGTLKRLLLHSKLFALIEQRIFNSRSVSRYIDYHHHLFNDPETWNPFANAVKKIQTIATSNSAQLVVVLFPLFDFPLDDKYPFQDIHLKVDKFMTENQIPVLDLFPTYKGLLNTRLENVVGGDSHPNEIGHRIAAESIYSFLEGKNLIPKDLQIQRKYKVRNSVLQKSKRQVHL